GDLVLPVEPRGDFTDLAHRIKRERHRVGAHVGDEPDAALADVQPLVQPLREAHGAARVEAELAGSLLLQRGGGERWRRVAAALLALDGDDAQRARHTCASTGGDPDAALDLACLGLAGEAELLDLATAVFEELERKLLAA